MVCLSKYIYFLLVDLIKNVNKQFLIVNKQTISFLGVQCGWTYQ
jgi:hypothetical protein